VFERITKYLSDTIMGLCLSKTITFTLHESCPYFFYTVEPNKWYHKILACFLNVKLNQDRKRILLSNRDNKIIFIVDKMENIILIFFHRFESNTTFYLTHNYDINPLKYNENILHKYVNLFCKRDSNSVTISIV
jgi:hypothetical protein